MKAISSVVAAVLIATISITLVGTTYFFSQGVLKGTTAEAFEVIDVFSNKIIVRNIGTQKINNFTVLVDGKAINAKIEQPVEPGNIGTVVLNLTDVPAGRHELVIMSKNMSQRWTWEFQYVSETTATTPETTTTFSEATATGKTEGGGKLITIQTGLGKLLADWVVNSQVNSSTCTEGSPCVYPQYQIITANATVKCSNPSSTCGSMKSGIRYNDTGNVMKLIDKTKGATPMYVLEGGDDYYDKYIYSWWNFSVNQTAPILKQPTGIAYNGTYFWVTNYTPPKVFRYNKTGDYDVSWSLDCSSWYTGLYGIDVNDTHIFVIGVNTNNNNYNVSTYDMAGNYKTGFNVYGSGPGQTLSPQSVVYNGTYFWVLSSSVQNSDKWVYRYTSNGNYDNWKFNYTKINVPGNPVKTSGGVNGQGLEFNGTHFFIADLVQGGWVFAYNLTGNYTGWYFIVNTSSTSGINPYGLAYSESEKNFYIVDWADRYVRRFTRNSTLGFLRMGT